MKIVIIGAGWYGLYIAKKLIEANDSNNEIIIIERASCVFDGNASRYNQCRLHLGFHYPRSHDTRKLCRKGYDDFLKEFPDLAYDIKNNLYLISSSSLLDYETYYAIFDYEQYNFDKVEHEILKCHSTGIVVSEKGVDPEKAAIYFKGLLENKVTFMFDHNVTSISKGIIEYPRLVNFRGIPIFASLVKAL